MSKVINVTGSYLQGNRHSKVTEKYNLINPSLVGEVMASHGLILDSLKTRVARHEDKLDFQRTFARYRGPEIAPGIFLDIIHDSKKLGRGVDRLILGIYRLICTNGLVVGKSFFQKGIRHVGNTVENLNKGITDTLTMQLTLVNTVKLMQNRQLGNFDKLYLVKQAETLLVPAQAENVQGNLLNVRRDLDQGDDLWTVFNVIQENAMRGGVGYTIPFIDAHGRLSNRYMNTRPIKGQYK